MPPNRRACGVRFVVVSLVGLLSASILTDARAGDEEAASRADSFAGTKAGGEREVAGVKLCWCPPGRFTMGSPPSEPERRPAEDQVEVTLTKGFWMAKYEATQGQWKRVVGKLPGPLTAELPEGDDLPVGTVNFAEAEAFCQKLTERGRQSGILPKDWEFRLPTEAQWEYACRAGTTTATSFGDQLSSKQANFKGKPYNGAEPGPSLGRAAKVGSYPANAWGLHDMHGNTFEWCRDWYHTKLPGGVDPDLYSAKATAVKNRTGDWSRVRRGGAWTDDGWPCRSAFRLRFEPERRYDHIGFRVVAMQLSETVVGYEAFDQTPGGGWRKLADAGQHRAAAEMVDRYERERRDLLDWQRVNLRFHAGQLYAFADQQELALERLQSAIVANEPADSPVAWNAYVRATIAFLQRDRAQLIELRDAIAKGPKLMGAVPNLEVVERLLKYFDEPYAVAYRGKSDPSK